MVTKIRHGIKGKFANSGWRQLRRDFGFPQNLCAEAIFCEDQISRRIISPFTSSLGMPKTKQMPTLTFH